MIETGARGPGRRSAGLNARRYRVPVNLDLVSEVLADEPAYRSRQVWEWAVRGASSYAEMTNLPLRSRELLEERVPFSALRLVHQATSVDGTVKALFHTAEGHPIEAVLMRFRDGRRSVCVSSQSGCPLTCTFCATGQMQFRRNLTAWEILDQVLHFKRIEPVDHVVFMGMGEPMLNFDNVIAAARRLPDLGATPRRTTISTVGWMPGLTRFDDVLAECRRYFELRGRKVFVEYVMLEGVNDSVEHAAELADLLDRDVFKVNLIPYNPTGMYEGSTRETIARFKAVLDGARLPSTVRLTRGRDIAAACGQLAVEAT